MLIELTTVADDSATFHLRQDPGAREQGPVVVDHLDGLEPDAAHDHHGIAFRTLPRRGPLRCRFATVNDVHFGEVEAGRIDDHAEGPIRRVPLGAEPYPEMMNRSAVAEMAAHDLAAVVVKGDLTSDGSDEQFAAFEECYRPAFGERLHVVRGNHDAYLGQDRYADDEWIELDGVAIALLDTAVPTRTNGSISAVQIEWLDALAAASTVPVLVMGHHQQWVGGARSDDYFGLTPDASDALAAVFARRRSLLAYTAGHTHRHRVRPFADGVPSIEVGCVKDFPGTWAEYRVHEGGILQVVHRISTPAALEWSEQCRDLYADFGLDYAEYAMGSLAERCFLIPLRG